MTVDGVFQQNDSLTVTTPLTHLHRRCLMSHTAFSRPSTFTFYLSLYCTDPQHLVFHMSHLQAQLDIFNSLHEKNVFVQKPIADFFFSRGNLSSAGYCNHKLAQISSKRPFLQLYDDIPKPTVSLNDGVNARV